MKIEFDEQKLKALEVLITAGGKSPQTDTSMMLLASDMLRYLAGQIELANKAQAAALAATEAGRAAPAKEDTDSFLDLREPRESHTNGA